MNPIQFIKKFAAGHVRLIGGSAAILAIAIGIWYVVAGAKPTLGSYTVSRGNVISSVNIPGTVSSSNNVDLSFQESGRIAKMYVQEGQLVTQGQELASLDNSAQQTSLSQQEATLASAQANYKRLLDGATVQDVKTSQDAVNSAQQNLTNAYSGAINTLNNASTAMYNADTVAITLQKNYFTSQDSSGIAVSGAKNDIDANLQSAQNSVATAQKSMAPSDIDVAVSQIISSLNSVYADTNIIRNQSSQGTYYYAVTDADKASLDAQKTALNAALTAATALQQNIASLKLSLQTAQDQLNVTTAPPTQANIDLQKAQIAAAEAQIQNAQLAISNAIIVAPFSGIARNVIGQAGMVVSPNVPVLSIINNGIMKVDAYASQTDVSQIQPDAMANVMLDAYGNGVEFPAKVSAIDTAGTMVNGSPAYHVTLYFASADDRIRTGMTGNVSIVAGQHDNVVEIPLRLVLDNSGTDIVLVKHGNSTMGRQVALGLIGNDGMVEIVSGLQTGDELSDY